jgi:hypothetical protein
MYAYDSLEAVRPQDVRPRRPFVNTIHGTAINEFVTDEQSDSQAASSSSQAPPRVVLQSAASSSRQVTIIPKDTEIHEFSKDAVIIDVEDTDMDPVRSSSPSATQQDPVKTPPPAARSTVTLRSRLSSASSSASDYQQKPTVYNYKSFMSALHAQALPVWRSTFIGFKFADKGSLRRVIQKSSFLNQTRVKYTSEQPVVLFDSENTQPWAIIGENYIIAHELEYHLDYAHNGECEPIVIIKAEEESHDDEDVVTINHEETQMCKTYKKGFMTIALNNDKYITIRVAIIPHSVTALCITGPSIVSTCIGDLQVEHDTQRTHYALHAQVDDLLWFATEGDDVGIYSTFKQNTECFQLTSKWMQQTGRHTAFVYDLNTEHESKYLPCKTPGVYPIRALDIVKVEDCQFCHSVLNGSKQQRYRDYYQAGHNEIDPDTVESKKLKEEDRLKGQEAFTLRPDFMTKHFVHVSWIKLGRGTNPFQAKGNCKLACGSMSMEAFVQLLHEKHIAKEHCNSTELCAYMETLCVVLHLKHYCNIACSPNYCARCYESSTVTGDWCAHMAVPPADAPGQAVVIEICALSTIQDENRRATICMAVMTDVYSDYKEVREYDVYDKDGNNHEHLATVIIPAFLQQCKPDIVYLAAQRELVRNFDLITRNVATYSKPVWLTNVYQTSTTGLHREELLRAQNNKVDILHHDMKKLVFYKPIANRGGEVNLQQPIGDIDTQPVCTITSITEGVPDPGGECSSTKLTRQEVEQHTNQLEADDDRAWSMPESVEANLYEIIKKPVPGQDPLSSSSSSSSSAATGGQLSDVKEVHYRRAPPLTVNENRGIVPISTQLNRIEIAESEDWTEGDNPEDDRYFATVLEGIQRVHPSNYVHNITPDDLLNKLVTSERLQALTNNALYILGNPIQQRPLLAKCAVIPSNNAMVDVSLCDTKTCVNVEPYPAPHGCQGLKSKLASYLQATDEHNMVYDYTGITNPISTKVLIIKNYIFTENLTIRAKDKTCYELRHGQPYVDLSSAASIQHALMDNNPPVECLRRSRYHKNDYKHYSIPCNRPTPLQSPWSISIEEFVKQQPDWP